MGTELGQGAQADWFAIPKLVPVKIIFDMRAILPVLIMFIVTAVETVGDISGVMEGGMSREAPIRSCPAVSSAMAWLFLCRLLRRSAQHLLQPERGPGFHDQGRQPRCIGYRCHLPDPLRPDPQAGRTGLHHAAGVLGGAAVMMFSSIVVSGIQLITKEKMTPRTLTIVSVALGVGYGMGANASILAHTPQFFQLICGESGIVPAAFVAIVLNVLLPKDDKAE